jgi:hypothetical protein
VQLPLTPSQRDGYHKTGFLCPVDALEPPEAERFRRAYFGVAAAFGGAPKAVQMSQIHRFYGWAWELATHPTVLAVAESVLGADILLWSASVFPKPARDSGYVSMHQDGTYWGLDGGAVTTAWIALTDSTRANGCMRVLPGSHLLEIQPHTDTYAEDNLLTRGQEIQVEYDESDVVDLELRAGQLSLHHVRAIHGSHANGSDMPRIGFAARYVTPDAKPLLPDQSAALVRGRDRFGHWDLRNDPPEYPSMESAVLAHREEAAKFVAALTSG